MRDDHTTREISAQMVPITTGLPIVEVDEYDEWTADETCQYIQENIQLRLLDQGKLKQKTTGTLASIAAAVLEAPTYGQILATEDMPPKEIQPMGPTKYALEKGDEFPTERRPTTRELTKDTRDVVNEWFEKSAITIESKVDTKERRDKSQKTFIHL